MTKNDKATLRAMIREGKSDKEILRYVYCALSTVRKYRKALAWGKSNADNQRAAIDATLD